MSWMSPRTLPTQAAISITNARAIALQAEQAQLRMEKTLAEKANEAKSEFLSNISHELRTPLNGILGYAQILKRNDDFTNSQRQGINTIYSSGAHLRTLINDILDLSKIEARKMEIFPVPMNLVAFVEDVAAIIKMQCQEKKRGKWKTRALVVLRYPDHMDKQTKPILKIAQHKGRQ